MEATPYLNKCTEIILNLLSLNNLKLFVFAIPYWPPPCTKLCFLNLRVWDTAMSGSISFFIGAAALEAEGCPGHVHRTICRVHVRQQELNLRFLNVMLGIHWYSTYSVLI